LSTIVAARKYGRRAMLERRKGSKRCSGIKGGRAKRVQAARTRAVSLFLRNDLQKRLMDEARRRGLVHSLLPGGTVCSDAAELDDIICDIYAAELGWMALRPLRRSRRNCEVARVSDE
jgi:hypothetical protein